MNVIVLGASGMLGSMALDYLRKDGSFDVVATARNERTIRELNAEIPDVEWRTLDAYDCSTDEITKVLGDATWAFNAIGVIKPYIHDDNPDEIERAIRVNAFFPHILAKAANRTSCRVLQIETDCVYSGTRGNYAETDQHDPLDVYGKTKSLGEVFAPNFYHLRCSIIGPEPKAHISLLDWLLKQQNGSPVNGYANHAWNGITTLHFAKVLSGIIVANQELPHVQHIIPKNRVSKYELLLLFEKYFKKNLEIKQAQAQMKIDRTLTTINPKLNELLWKGADYSEPPSVQEMVEELAHYKYPFAQPEAS